MKSDAEQLEECCPVFNPTLWEDHRFEWENKLFIKDRVFSVFYIPINYAMVMNRLHKSVTKAGGNNLDWLCLSDHTSMWNIDLYLAVDKEIPLAQNVVLKGKFYSKVYEGPFSDTKKWCNDFDTVAKRKGLQIKRQYLWYTTCPKCAEKFGKNYVVIIGQVE